MHVYSANLQQRLLGAIAVEAQGETVRQLEAPRSKLLRVRVLQLHLPFEMLLRQLRQQLTRSIASDCFVAVEDIVTGTYKQRPRAPVHALLPMQSLSHGSFSIRLGREIELRLASLPTTKVNAIKSMLEMMH